MSRVDNTIPDRSGAGSPLLAMKSIGKSFGSVRVLDGVDFEVAAGEVHILAGENGAGKSTLIKILAGVYDDWEGSVTLEGQPARFVTPQQARHAGIAVIYQEISLVGTLSIADNLFLGREQTGRGGWLDRRTQREAARGILESLDLDLDLNRPAESYPISIQQMVEIAKALSLDARVIVMDEPTSTLTRPEAERLFGIIARLKQRGVGIIYISHKMDEIYRLADRITVLRDGTLVGTKAAAELPEDEFVRWMVGREITSQFPERAPKLGETILKVSGLTLRDPVLAGRNLVDRCSFELRKGEILGIAGLQGSGNSELLHALFGSWAGRTSGQVLLDGKPFAIKNPGHSIRSGLALLTNDRQGNGCVTCMGVRQNMTLAALEKFSPGLWLNHAAEVKAANSRAAELSLRAASLEMPVGNLSGGNQQKVILAKWLEAGPLVFMMDEPTRGVDVGVKQEIYQLLNRWTAAGASILLITSEMPELLAMSDRVLVMSSGRITAEFGCGEATQEKILAAAMSRAGEAA
jgi:ABC-type sugar transport system ATPase subunit